MMNAVRKFAWKIDGQGGQMKVKSRGPCCMVAGYLCTEVGLWPDSLTFITPGKDKDPWWDGEQTQDQAKRHLLVVDAWIATLDIHI